MKWQYKIEEKRLKYNIIYGAIILLLVFSLFFSNFMSHLLYLKPSYVYSNETEIHCINVGQGDAIVIKFNTGKVMLIDSGTESYCDKLINYIDNIIKPRNNTIDYLVLTHKDSDHSGNMLEILNKYNVDVFYRPYHYSAIENNSTLNSSLMFDKIISLAINKNIEMKYNCAGIQLVEGLTTLTWLSPLINNENVLMESNEYSPVIKLDYKGNSALFTGDVSSDTEQEILQNYSADYLDIDILKIAHHGSASSTSEDFLDVTTPDFACISVGENTYGHPSNKLLSRIVDYDNKHKTSLFKNTYCTLDKGNIIFVIGDEIVTNFIVNIDDYLFIEYYVFVVIAIFIVLFFASKPYLRIFNKNIRFIIQNKSFEKYLEKEKRLIQQKNNDSIGD